MDDTSWDKLADRKKYFEEISSPFAHLTTERKLKNAINSPHPAFSHPLLDKERGWG